MEARIRRVAFHESRIIGAFVNISSGSPAEILVRLNALRGELPPKPIVFIGLPDLPDSLRSDLPFQFIDGNPKSIGTSRAMRSLLAMIQSAPALKSPNSPPSDPQKGQWGGQDTSNFRRLRASFTLDEVDTNWFHLRLWVESTDEKAHPLRREVTFHLHPTFKGSPFKSSVTNGRAVLNVRAWGLFTVGAEIKGEDTRLELDLSELPDTPKQFRNR